MITLTLIDSASETSTEKNNATFNITSIGEDNITMSLTFANPGLISRNGRENEVVF